ncbi:hypothetical protein CsatA_027008 [Cannabis sativa]
MGMMIRLLRPLQTFFSKKVSIQQESVASDFGREVNGNDDQTVEAIANLFVKER